MATDNDVTRLTVEITNLEFATRCFREAAGVMRAQRDEARREAYALRHRIRIAALVIVVTVLLVIGVVACVEAAETARPQHLVRIDRAAAETAAWQAVVPGTAQGTELTDYNGHVVYEVVVAPLLAMTYQVERFPLGRGEGAHGTRTGATHNIRRPLPPHPPPLPRYI